MWLYSQNDRENRLKDFFSPSFFNICFKNISQDILDFAYDYSSKDTHQRPRIYPYHSNIDLIRWVVQHQNTKGGIFNKDFYNRDMALLLKDIVASNLPNLNTIKLHLTKYCNSSKDCKPYRRRWNCDVLRSYESEFFIKAFNSSHKFYPDWLLIFVFRALLSWTIIRLRNIPNKRHNLYDYLLE